MASGVPIEINIYLRRRPNGNGNADILIEREKAKWSKRSPPISSFPSLSLSLSEALFGTNENCRTLLSLFLRPTVPYHLVLSFFFFW